MAKPPLIFIHGAFCGGWCFDAFRAPFEAAGYATQAPDLPGHAPHQPASALSGVSLSDYARAVDGLIAAERTPPVLIGHSLGGLVAQLAAARRRVAGLILLAPSPAWGQPVTSPVELAASVVLPASRGAYWLEPVAPDWPTVRSLTFDRLPQAQARALYEKMTSESGRALFEVLNWWLDPTFSSLVTPIAHLQRSLVVSGGMDRVHATATVSGTALRLCAEAQVMPTMSHWMVDEPEAPQLAKICLDWLARL